MVVPDVAFRVLVLTALSAAGYAAGKLLRLQANDISKLLIYIITPTVVFLVVLQAPDDKHYLSFTAASFLLCTIFSVSAFGLSALFWSDNTRNLFAFSGGTGNTGYFALPIAMSVFGETGAATAVYMMIGVMLYEFSLGFYIASVGRFSPLESISRVIKVPTFYAFLIAILVKPYEAFQSDVLLSSLENFKGAYTLLGMLVIGITLSTFNNLQIDGKYIALSLFWKFGIWPLSCFALISVFAPYLSQVDKAVIMFMSVVPIAGNTVIIASALNLQPQKAATAVIASTVFSVVSVPLAIALFQ